MTGPFRRLLSVLPLFLVGSSSVEVIEAGKFSTAPAGGPLPEGWTAQTFKAIERHTSYSLVACNGKTAVMARSEGAASGLTRKLRVDPREYPILSWRWKVEGLLPAADLKVKKADDAPARVYVTFAYDPAKVGFFEKAKFETVRLFYGEYPPLAALTYVWASRESAGAAFASPYTDRSRVIVVEGGPEKVQRWVDEERDVFQDYRRVFGEDPPAVSGVAIMTDTDNTGGSATAYYGDIVFRKR